ncbi:MAG: 4Fe-4S double cluster binding domain-containing protein [Desulfobaccales bacterium]
MNPQEAKPICSKVSLAAGNKRLLFSRDQLRQLCLDAGADDAGLVDIAQEDLAGEQEGILRVYPATRSIIALIRVLNRENLQSPARYPANDESHCVGDEFSRICRDILRRLNERGIRGVVLPKAFPMDMSRWPGKIWDVSHKTISVAAGLGHMGVNRLVMHPKHGNYLQLNSILINAEVDQYDEPLADNPCIKCGLCADVCPVGAISQDGTFDFRACSTHSYRYNMMGFQDWIDAVISSADMGAYRARFQDRETAALWQSLMFRIDRCGYCMGVCPAGEDVKGEYLADKKTYYRQLVKPLKERPEPVYVATGSRAEEVARRNPHKEVRCVQPFSVRR